MRVYYFGCESKERIGHYLFTPGMRSAHYEERRLPFKPSYIGEMLPSHTPQSEAHVVHACGFTAIVMGDYSADKRSGCSAAFFAEGTFNFQQMLDLFATSFSTQFKRINGAAPIIEKTPGTQTVGGSNG